MSPARRFLLLFLICTAYSIVRYNLVLDVPWARFPAWLMNKVFSSVSVGSLMLAARAFVKLHSNDARFFGRASFHCALIHSCLSLILISASNYPDFFGVDGDQLNLKGQLVALAGALAIWLYWLLFQTHPKADQFRALKIGASVLVALHLLPMGIPKWGDPSAWSGLPPISLLSMGFVVGAIAWLVVKRKK